MVVHPKASRAIARALGIAAAVLIAVLANPASPAFAEPKAVEQPVLTAGSCAATVELEWGFKESFRAYIDGSIANGEWTTSDGARYETPTFFWSDGEGALDVELARGVADFGGAVTFTGHGGILATTIANPYVVLRPGTGSLVLDVSGTTQDGREVERTAVEFATLALSEARVSLDGEVLVLEDIPATLTAAGADAFGTYPAGDSLDAVTLRYTAEPGCALAVPDFADRSWPLWALFLVPVLAAVLSAVLGAALARGAARS